MCPKHPRGSPSLSHGCRAQLQSCQTERPARSQSEQGEEDVYTRLTSRFVDPVSVKFDGTLSVCSSPPSTSDASSFMCTGDLDPTNSHPARAPMSMHHILASSSHLHQTGLIVSATLGITKPSFGSLERRRNGEHSLNGLGLSTCIFARFSTMRSTKSSP
ncbi:hypothetical protein SISNIDRAFT_282142 [Sistotremastrum niveocremeum HHB9708]|uniref:Uncharacterized protein n=1 Tax=Sistotremastrum niveocremeum HHB9708 TaxID=1314777 RepID=A0A164Y772_9AGAM|nr:hypothetical protein SISNIDRAFT_282142 [Sistotremastrum niveocremeum HHB9708]